MRLDPRRCLIPMLFAATCAAATDADRIEIQADTAELDREAGRSVYRGDVVLTRAGLELYGDELMVSRGEGERITAVLTGDPARLRQIPAGDGDAPITGAAERMTYETGREQIELQGGAVIERGGNVLSGENITHDMASGRTSAHRADGEGGERVHITLDSPPENQPVNRTDQPDQTDRTDEQPGRTHQADPAGRDDGGDGDGR
jgi:lipopolysaccharide transport protein LptA